MSTIDNMLKLFVNLSEKQLVLLKWRLSDDAKPYYSALENKTFYEAVENGDTKVIDAIRKEKQKIIDNLLKCLQVFVMSSILFLTACSNFNHKILEEKYDVNSLTKTDITYPIQNMQLKIDGDDKYFEDKWFIASEDIIKKYNENQDNLILALNKVKDVEAKLKRERLYFLLGFVAISMYFSYLVVRKK